MAKIILNGHIEIAEDDLNAVLLERPSHIALTRQEAGCLAFKVERDLTNPHRFDVYEAFIDKASFDKHQARVKASHWGRVTKNVERFYTITEG